MKKFLSVLLISLTCFLFVGCSEFSEKWNFVKYDAGISNFYNYAVNSFEESYSHNLEGVGSTTDDNITFKNLETLKGGYVGAFYNFMNFMPALDYAMANKKNKELYSYTRDNQTYLFEINRMKNSNKASKGDILLQVYLTSASNNLLYTVKVNRKTEYTTVVCPKIKNFVIEKDLEGKDVNQTFRINYDDKKSYLKIVNFVKGEKEKAKEIKYEVCLDSNNNLIYRRDVFGVIDYEIKLKTNVNGFEMMILCSKDFMKKLEHKSFIDEKFSYRNFAHETNFNSYVANIVYSKEKVKEDTYQAFIESISPSGTVSAAFSEAFNNSLIMGEN